jgi:SagB-type dehydrogenase family enzyme
MADRVDAVTYHERTKHSPRSVRESDFRLDFGNKPRPYKIYADLPTVPLPDAGGLPAVPALRAIAGRGPERPSGRITRRTVADLCYYAAGITKTLRRDGREVAFRAAATTGALYHVDLYVVCGSLPRLDAGVYHYDPRSHSLDVVRDGDFREALAGAAGDAEAVRTAPLSVVATSTWWRNAWKYRERTYRHAFWDSGTCLANLLAVATALGLWCPGDDSRPGTPRVRLGFVDAAVAELLGVDPDREAPLELVALGTDAETASAPPSPPVEALDPETIPHSRRELDYELIRAAYRGSSLPDPGAVTEWWESVETAEADWLAAPGDGPRVELEPVNDERASKTPVDVTVERRGSCREYARESLDGRKVATILDRALANGGTALDPAPQDPAGTASRSLRFVDCYLLVNDVAGVPSGAYQYHPTEGALERLREGAFRREAGHLALDQRLAADTGLVAFFATDVESIQERLGSRGYRLAQFEAALAAGRLYLAAYAHRDLGATGLTFYDDEVTDFFSPRATNQTPMFCWTLGRPA